MFHSDETSAEATAIDGDRILADLSAADRVAWALEHLPGPHVLSSSFGAQAAVSLHMLTLVAPSIPVILVDTGYLFPETYRFIDELTERLSLNLKVFRASRSPAWQEARHGERWSQGLAGIEAYNEENKVEPMHRALNELGANTWFAGLRREQSRSRANTPYLSRIDGRWKVHPIADWNEKDIQRYLSSNRLPSHPLLKKGFISIGDHHSTRAIQDVASIEDTRFFGLKRECGIHDTT